MVTRKILLNPGPATTSERVKLAQIVPDICPREAEFGNVIENITKKLTSFVGDNNKYTTVLFGGSGTAAVESVISTVVKPNDKLLIIDNGAYGKRMCEIARAYDLNFIEYKSSLLNPIDIEYLDKVVSESNVTHLSVVHNETTTGLLNDIKQIGEVCKKNKVVLIVDAMSSYGAIPIDMDNSNISYLCASSNKNIQGMAGVSFVIGCTKSLNALVTVKSRNYYLNLYAQYEGFKNTRQMRFTPPVQTLYALQEAIDELELETIKARYERYSESWLELTVGLKKLGLKYLIDEAHHSKIITSVIIPEEINFEEMHDFLYARNITIYPGKIDELNTFRIANIGDIDKLDILVFLNALKEYLNSVHNKYSL
jgi:2-aminoethylphosphonate-pyruvate transaminase